MRIPCNSLRTRFAIAISLWVLFGTAAIWASATEIFTRNSAEGFHDELKVHIQELAGLAEIGPDGRARMQRPLSDPRYLIPQSGFYWQITAPGLPPLRSPSMTRGMLDDSVAIAPKVRHTIESGPTGPAITYGLSRVTSHGKTVRFVIATDIRHLDQVVDRFNRALSFRLAGIAFGLLVTGLAIIAFGLRPLDRLTIATARLRAGQTATLEGEYPAEIAPLVDDLNAYVTRNEEIVTRARVQAGNLAHALRTPLAVMTDEVEQMAKNPANGESARVLLQQSGRMARQVEFHLAQARLVSACVSASQALTWPK